MNESSPDTQRMAIERGNALRIMPWLAKKLLLPFNLPILYKYMV